MKINQFQTNSDYGTLKNDTQTITISATITAGTVWNISNNILAQATVSAGTINAGIRARGSSSKYPMQVVGTTLYSEVLYSIPSFPGAGTMVLTLYCTLERISATTMRLTVASESGSGSPNFRLEDTQTITFVFSTFLSPFN